MRRIIKTVFPAVLCVISLWNCTREEAAGFKAGACIAQARVSADEGHLSVSVETSGTWRLSCDESWVSFDVEGGRDNQAFTVYYTSNVPDILNLKKARSARIAISLDDSMVSDTLVLTQQGFLGEGRQVKVQDDPKISVEFDDRTITQATFILCSSEGLEDDTLLRTWLQEKGADAFVLDGETEGSLEGISIAGCDFADFDAAAEYMAFKALVDGSMNSSYEAGDSWIVAGQMYHYSSMQVGYRFTPSWYPSDAKGDDFRSDRYAWQNNLYDCVWMAEQNFVTTYTDAEGHGYAADYVYVSSSVLGKVSSVQLVAAPVAGMTHKAIVLHLKY